MAREKILIITRNFPPLVGGMERLMEHAVGQLSQHYSCTLIGPSGCAKFAPPPTEALGCRIAPLPLFLLQAMFQTMAASSRKKYRFSLAGSGVTAPLAGMVKLRHQIPAIAFVHGLDLTSDNRVYQRFFVPWLRRMDLVIANSRNTARLAENQGVAPDRIRILHPGVALPRHLPGKDADFLARHDLVGKKVLLSVGRLVPRKGLSEFLQHSFPAIIAACPETVLVIIGTEPGNSLKRADGTRLGIEKLVANQGLGNHLRFLGNVTDETLSQAYGAADLLIFPVLELPGDVEGFGMVAIEAAAHGLPTLAFAAGGVPDAIRDNYSGFLVNSGDYRGFAEVAVRNLTGASPLVSKSNCRDFASGFEWQHFGEQLVEICSAV
jgi:phosphatidylinositol alpha-1,6-mannosyltransferase